MSLLGMLTVWVVTPLCVTAAYIYGCAVGLREGRKRGYDQGYARCDQEWQVFRNV
jgi:hypothetical protein